MSDETIPISQDEAGSPVNPAAGPQETADAAPADDGSQIPAVMHDHDINPAHPRGDEAMAYEMSEAMRPGEQMINNIAGSNLPSKEEMITNIRERGEELAEEARQRYLEERIQCDKIRDMMMGNLIYATTSAEPQPYAQLFEIRPTEDKHKYLEASTGAVISGATLNKLLEELFVVTGADISAFRNSGDRSNLSVDRNGWRNRVFPTNIAEDFMLVEQTIMNESKDAGKNDLAQIRFSMVTSDYDLEPAAKTE